jgi:hypothetical protein
MSDETPNNGNLINFIAATVETIREQMATKSDIARLEAEITAIRGDIERIDLRLDSIERTIRVPRSDGRRDQSSPQRHLPSCKRQT